MFKKQTAVQAFAFYAGLAVHASSACQIQAGTHQQTERYASRGDAKSPVTAHVPQQQI